MVKKANGALHRKQKYERQWARTEKNKKRKENLDL